MKRSSTRNIFIAFILNIVFSIFELIGGFFSNSISIIADSIHDFGDAISIFVVFILEKISKRKPDQNYTFGYLRYSILGALITSLILFFGSIFIIFNSLERLVNPVEVHYDGMIFLSILGITINLVANRITSDSNNLNQSSVSLHMLEDVLGWLCVFIGSIIIKVTNLYIIDPILSIFVSMFILVSVIKRLKNILDIILEKKPNQINMEKIKNNLMKISNIKEIHHIHIWTIDGINNYITLHVVIDDNIMTKELEEIKREINIELKKNDINHSTIEFEVKKCENITCNIDNNNLHNHIHHH